MTAVSRSLPQQPLRLQLGAVVHSHSRKNCAHSLSPASLPQHLYLSNEYQSQPKAQEGRHLLQLAEFQVAYHTQLPLQSSSQTRDKHRTITLADL